MENPFELILEKLTAIEKAIENLKISNEIKTERKLMDVNEVAIYLNLAVSSIYGLVHQNKIPYYKLAKKLYFIKTDIDMMILKGRNKTKSEINLLADEYILKHSLK